MFKRPLIAVTLAGLLFSILIQSVGFSGTAYAQPSNLNLNGVWSGEGVVIQIIQQEASNSFSSMVVKDEKCEDSPRDSFLTGTIQGERVEGTYVVCSDPENLVVTECGEPRIWETDFEATASEYEIVGTFKGEIWTWDTDDEGNIMNCTLDYNYNENFSLSRVDCQPLTFEKLAIRYPNYASEIDLAKRFENGETLVWSEEQVSSGFKAEVAALQEGLRSWGYSSSVNSAYRPVLYQAHFADLRLCALDLLDALAQYPELADALNDSITKVNAEVSKHGIKSETHTVSGKSIKVPFVCYREPLTSCPHVSGEAVDMTITPADNLDWVAAIYDFCRPYKSSDPPHWERVGNERCGEYGPGNADIEITGDSPINILATDPDGRRIGFDPETSKVVNDFGQDAFYSGTDTHPQLIRISSYASTIGEYSVTGIGTGNGQYTLTVNIISGDGYLVDSKVVEGVASVNKTITGLVHPFTNKYKPMNEWIDYQDFAYDDSNELDSTARISFDAQGNTFDIAVDGFSISDSRFNIEQRAILLASDGTAEHVKVTIPKQVLGGDFVILIDGKKVTFDKVESDTHTILEFDVSGDSKFIFIQGTTVIPEFPLSLLMMVVIGVLILFPMVMKRKFLS